MPTDRTDSTRVQRKLAAILAADIAGYSALMGSDEKRTVRDLKAHQAVVLPMVDEFHGRIIDTAGDGILAEFASVVNAVECAIAIQKTMAERNLPINTSHQMQFRIGINTGDVIYDEARIYGDGINVAARLEAIADPGGICLSAKVYEEIDGRVDIVCQDLGDKHLKNIARPVQVFRVCLSQAGVQTPTIRASSLTEKPSIAVLPLKNLSGDQEQEYFADGLTEDIITAISYWRTFPVIARNSVFTYKGRSIRISEVARELGARYILEGSVRKAGDRVRISLALSDADFGQQLWAERFDRPLNDIFELQDEIARKVAATLGYQIEQAEIVRTRRGLNNDFNAWDLVAQGLPHFYVHSKEANNIAKEFFARAVSQDPDYSDAWAYFAWTHSHDIMIGGDSDKQSNERLGFEAARRAVALDEQSALAHLALSSVYVWTGNLREALRYAQRALELNPNDVRAGLAVGNRLTLLGSLQEGIEKLEATLPLNPLDPFRWHYFGFLCRAFLSLGGPGTAMTWAERAVQIRPDHADNHFRLALCHAHLGELDAASRALAECTRLAPDLVEQRRSWQPYPDPERNAYLIAPLRDSGLL